MNRFVVTPTILLKEKKDLSGRYFSMIPCTTCGTEGVAFEVSIYSTEAAPYSHRNFLADSFLQSKKASTTFEQFRAARYPTDRVYCCSEACINLWILSNEER